MLLKVKDGVPNRMIHKGIWYNFAPGEVKDVPETMLLAFRGVLVMAEPRVKLETSEVKPIVTKKPEPIKPEPSGMVIINADPTKEEPKKTENFSLKKIGANVLGKKKSKKKTTKNKKKN